jgi:hypothetical protein
MVATGCGLPGTQFFALLAFTQWNSFARAEIPQASTKLG